MKSCHIIRYHFYQLICKTQDIYRLIYNDDLTDSNVGARKNRNIRDNIFVLNAIMNSLKKFGLTGGGDPPKFFSTDRGGIWGGTRFSKNFLGGGHENLGGIPPIPPL